MGFKSDQRKSTRKMAIVRDSNQCQVCDSVYSLQVHHVVHKSKGGMDTLDNLITLCSDCHLIVHNQLKSLVKSGIDVLRFKHIIILLK
jgi:5-methylcytosine-specific restriction endonuclease McrA